MAPQKFGLFKGRSRDQPEPPSTENLLNSCSDLVVYPASPLPSTSKGLYEDMDGFQEFSMMHLDSDDEDESEQLPSGRRTSVSKAEDVQVNYKPLPSTNATSTTTLQDIQDIHDQDYDFQLQLDDIQKYDIQKYDIQKYELVSPDDATSIDANSLQFDETSIASEEPKYCGATSKKQRKNKAKEEQKIQEQHNDCAMWQASNYEVLQHLLSRSGTLDEQIKWEAIATARGLCTLTATCACGDCRGGRAPPAVTDGDAGIGAAPLLGAVSVGCHLM